MLNSSVKLKKPKVVHKDLSSEHVYGFAYDDEFLIELDKNQSDKEYILTVVHELGHLFLPDLSEAQIVKFEKTFGAAVWKSVCRLKRKWKKQWSK